MKYVVFLCCFLLTTVIFSPAIKASDTFTFDNYDIIVTRHREGDGLGYRVEKTGETPFEVVLQDQGVSYYMNDVFVTDDYIMVYGYSHDVKKETYYDGFLHMIKTDGTSSKTSIIDVQMLEEVKDVYHINDVWVVVVDVSLDENREIIENGSYVMLYDMEGNEIDSTYFHKRILNTEESDVGIAINESYIGEFDWLYTTDGIKVSKNDSIELEDSAVYYGSLSLNFVGDARINEEIYRHGARLMYPGHYEINYAGKTSSFTIHPVIEGLTDDIVTTDGVQFEVSSGQVFVNDDLYTGEMIESPGSYDVTVRGVGGYEESMQFTITSNMSGVINDAVYQSDITIHFNGEGYLNNRYIESPYTITEAGEYTLKIEGENYYTEQYSFQMVEQQDDYSVIDFIQQFDIIVFIVVVLTGVLLWKKKT